MLSASGSGASRGTAFSVLLNTKTCAEMLNSFPTHLLSSYSFKMCFSVLMETPVAFYM